MDTLVVECSVSILFCLIVCISCSLPLGSQVIGVPVNSSLSWHTNRLRDNSKDAYNVSYAWKLVGGTCSLGTFTFTMRTPSDDIR